MGRSVCAPGRLHPWRQRARSPLPQARRGAARRSLPRARSGSARTWELRLGTALDALLSRTRRARNARRRRRSPGAVGRPLVRRPPCPRAGRPRAGTNRARRAARSRDPAPAARRLRLRRARARRPRFRLGGGCDRRTPRDRRVDTARVSGGGDSRTPRAAPRRPLALPLLPERGRVDVRRAHDAAAAAGDLACPDVARPRRRVRPRARRPDRRVPARAR